MTSEVKQDGVFLLKSVRSSEFNALNGGNKIKFASRILEIIGEKLVKDMLEKEQKDED